MKLKVQLARLGNAVFARVLEMDDGFRRVYGDDEKVLYKQPGRYGWRIVSLNQPAIDDTRRVLYVRGSHYDYDDTAAVLRTSGEAKAKIVYKQLVKLLVEFTGSAIAEGHCATERVEQAVIE